MRFRLLVEGPDDIHLIKNVAREYGVILEPNVEIHPCGGVHNLIHESLPIHLKGSYDSVGVVVDADLDVAARWQSLRDQLRAAGYNAPTEPAADGLILVSHKPIVGVWLMPDNTLPGTLEDFAQQLIPSDDPLWPRARAAVEAIPEEERRFVPAATRKAEIHTFLAWQESPGTPLGLAVTKQYFRTDAVLCQRFAAWLRRLRTET